MIPSSDCLFAIFITSDSLSWIRLECSSILWYNFQDANSEAVSEPIQITEKVDVAVDFQTTGHRLTSTQMKWQERFLKSKVFFLEILPMHTYSNGFRHPVLHRISEYQKAPLLLHLVGLHLNQSSSLHSKYVYHLRSKTAVTWNSKL